MIKKRLLSIQPEILMFLLASCLWGYAQAAGDAVFNNYFNETFHISNLKRSILEVPREIPGLIVVFVSALLSFLCSRRLAAVAMLMGAAGMFLLATAAPSFNIMLVWLFLLSMGQHLILPLSSSIGMELASDGQTGKRLGQFSGAKNVAAIIGSFTIFLGFHFLHFTFSTAFIVASIGYLGAALVLFRMKPVPKQPGFAKLKLYKPYSLYYRLSILYGARKQIFLTFAPWILVTVYRQPTAMVATLLTIGGVIGIAFQPILGKAIDRIGERFILVSEAFVLIFVCIGYGFAGKVFTMQTAFLIAACCYILDQLLMSVGMARATYLKKIAIDPSHVTSTLQMATSLDHIFSILGAVFSGLLWKVFGYQYVFLFAGLIAVANLFSAMQIRIPKKNVEKHITQPALNRV